VFGEDGLRITGMDYRCAVAAEEERFRRGSLRSRIGKNAPFAVYYLLAEDFGDGGKDPRIRNAGPVPVQALEALQTDATAEFRKPVDGFVHQSGIVAAEASGGEQQGLGIDDPVVARTRVSWPTRIATRWNAWF
jgi:hypothetical protein